MGPVTSVLWYDGIVWLWWAVDISAFSGKYFLFNKRTSISYRYSWVVYSGTEAIPQCPSLSTLPKTYYVVQGVDERRQSVVSFKVMLSNHQEIYMLLELTFHILFWLLVFKEKAIGSCSQCIKKKPRTRLLYLVVG